MVRTSGFHGLTAQGSYTYGHALDNVSGTRGFAPQDSRETSRPNTAMRTSTTGIRSMATSCTRFPTSESLQAVDGGMGGQQLHDLLHRKADNAEDEC